jgi:hypothetical protein
MTYELPEWLDNPHPKNTYKWWCCEQAIWEIVNDAGAGFDDAGKRIRKGKYSDLCDAVQEWRTRGRV